MFRKYLVSILKFENISCEIKWQIGRPSMRHISRGQLQRIPTEVIHRSFLLHDFPSKSACELLAFFSHIIHKIWFLSAQLQLHLQIFCDCQCLYLCTKYIKALFSYLYKPFTITISEARGTSTTQESRKEIKKVNERTGNVSRL